MLTMAEKSIWAYLKNGMRGKWSHAQRHECMINKGVADVSYFHFGNSWLELKEVKKLPARPTTGIKLGRWSDLHQRYFLIKRHGWLFIRVNYPERTYLLFSWKNLPPDVAPFWTWDELRVWAVCIWTNRVDFDELSEFLRNPK